MDFMGVMEGIGAVTKVLGDLWKVGYGTYQDQRDTNYQRDLQQQIFNREDNAVQRRMADLQAAGLNPNLAAGSSAGAGSVVGRSNAQNVNFDSGSMLDAINAVQQIGIQKQQQKNLQEEYKILQEKAKEANMGNVYNKVWLLSNLGQDFDITPKFDNGKVIWNFSISDSPFSGFNTPIFQQMKESLYGQKRHNKLLDEQLALAIKENNWYAVKQIFDLTNTATQSFGNVMSPFKSYLKPITPTFKQNYTESYTYDKHGYTKDRTYY